MSNFCLEPCAYFTLTCCDPSPLTLIMCGIMATSPFNSGGGRSSGIWSVIIIVTYIHGELSWTAFLLGDGRGQIIRKGKIKRTRELQNARTLLDALIYSTWFHNPRLWCSSDWMGDAPPHRMTQHATEANRRAQRCYCEPGGLKKWEECVTDTKEGLPPPGAWVLRHVVWARLWRVISPRTMNSALINRGSRKPVMMERFSAAWLWVNGGRGGGFGN